MPCCASSLLISIQRWCLCRGVECRYVDSLAFYWTSLMSLSCEHIHLNLLWVCISGIHTVLLLVNLSQLKLPVITEFVFECCYCAISGNFSIHKCSGSGLDCIWILIFRKRVDEVEWKVDERLTICNVLSSNGLHFLMLEFRDKITQNTLWWCYFDKDVLFDRFSMFSDGVWTLKHSSNGFL